MRYNGQAKTKILTLKTVVIGLIVILVAGYAITKLAKSTSSGPDERIALAECLTANDVSMYGAYWCPHCARQKQAFGSKAFSKVHYVECAVPGNRAEQTDACKKENITGYPTWIFGDGSRLNGEIELSELARKANCPYGDVQPEAAPSEDIVAEEGAPAGEATTPAEESGTVIDTELHVE